MRTELYEQLCKYLPMQDGILILKAIGFPTAHIPAATSAAQFWQDVLTQLEGGRLVDGERELIRVLMQEWPSNQVFREAGRALGLVSQEGPDVTRPAPDVTPSPHTAEVPIVPPRPAEPPHGAQAPSGRRQPSFPTLVYIGQEATALRFARAVPLADPGAHLAYHSFGQHVQLAMALTRPWDEYRVAQLRQELECPVGGRNGTIEQHDFDHRPHLLRINIQGPDHAPFELPDVPSTTTAGGVAQAVLGQYQDSASRDRRGRRRRTVVDHLQPDGSFVRLDPALSLASSGVRDGDTLNVFPESTAGAPLPLRFEAVHRVRGEIERYAAAHKEDFAVVHIDDVTFPTEFEVEFTAEGLAPPRYLGDDPVPAGEHRVLIVLGDDFPLRAPLVLWESPVFHPNVTGPDHPTAPEGMVCLGELMSAYQPTMDFGRLCQILVDMARYTNYEVLHHDEGGGGWVNDEAAAWARSPQGQAHITRLGGKTLRLDADGVPYVEPEPLDATSTAIRIRRRGTLDDQ
ncbi:effector-associated domain EAD1-containing protein [Kitasatospora sp. NPDC056181]|uniref:effector-associated domain EAD1-containing protein n=1 Tax=Kitasatospora sp. NPDC056181 TaxID=3345737 RepID=UPI0035DDB999